jgi:hypothetical protein
VVLRKFIHYFCLCFFIITAYFIGVTTTSLPWVCDAGGLLDPEVDDFESIDVPIFCKSLPTPSMVLAHALIKMPLTSTTDSLAIIE